MITLTILVIMFIGVAGVILALGAGFVAIFGDLIIAILVITGLVKLVKWFKNRGKEEAA